MDFENFGKNPMKVIFQNASQTEPNYFMNESIFGEQKFLARAPSHAELHYTQPFSFCSPRNSHARTQNNPIERAQDPDLLLRRYKTKRLWGGAGAGGRVTSQYSRMIDSHYLLAAHCAGLLWRLQTTQWWAEFQHNLLATSSSAADVPCRPIWRQVGGTVTLLSCRINVFVPLQNSLILLLLLLPLLPLLPLLLS